MSLAAGPSVEASYSVQTMGVGVGNATLRLEQMAERLAARFRFETAALLGLVEKTDTRMETLASGLRDALSLERFVGVYEKEDRTREVDITYGADGAIDAFALKKRGSVRINSVPAGLAAGTVDPIGAFLRARSWLEQATVGSELAMSVFDGRKRYDTTLRYLGLTQVSTPHGGAPAHQVSVRYQLRQSLDEDSGTLEPEKNDRVRELQMTVSTDGRYVPLGVEGNFDGMPLTATLTADCAGPGGCPD
ncbi:MAG: DUF3108 domain-containing protein [Geminicoccaceae bacterium]